MKSKKYLFSILSLLATTVIMQEPLIAAKRKVYAASDLAASCLIQSVTTKMSQDNPLSVIISVKTSEPTLVSIEYQSAKTGKLIAKPYDRSSKNTVIQLVGLVPSTAYSFRVVTIDNDGNRCTSPKTYYFNT